MFAVVREQVIGAAEGFRVMALPATVFTALLTYTGGCAEAFATWCGLSALDLVFGVVLAIAQRRFCITKLYHWVGRVCVQLLSITLFAAILHMLNIVAGVEVILANWLLFFYALMDFTSIMEKFLLLGFMPKPAFALLKFLRRRTAKVFAAAMNDEDLAEEIEKSLQGDKEATLKDLRKRRPRRKKEETEHVVPAQN